MFALTHAVAGLAISDLIDNSRSAAVLAALVADFDMALNFAQPFIRNGAMHSITAALILTFIVKIAFADDRIWKGFLSGYISHLFIDILGMNGIMLFFPVNWFFSFNVLQGYGLVSNLAIMSFATIATVEKRTHTVRNIINSIVSGFDSRSRKR